MIPTHDVFKVKTVPIEQREDLVHPGNFSAAYEPKASFQQFIDSLPRTLAANDFRTLVDAIVTAKENGAGILWMLGGHVVKTGLAPLLIHLMDLGCVSFLAGNGSVAIHDYELARFGSTSENVAEGLKDGTFGMAEETGRGMNRALLDGSGYGEGCGEALGASLCMTHPLASLDISLLIAAYKRKIPFGIFSAIGCEIIHQHPEADGAAIGRCSMTDFRRLAAWLPNLEGGVVINVGSRVIMPEVFLKALTVSRNVSGAPMKFTACDMDMVKRYRPWNNVVKRPTESGGGTGIQLIGHHEINLPLLVWAVSERLG